jgi:phage-related tail fiber protein
VIVFNRCIDYYDADDIDETSSKHSFQVPGVDLAYNSSSSSSGDVDEDKVPKFGFKKSSQAYNKDTGNYQQLMNSYKMSGYSYPVHY